MKLLLDMNQSPAWVAVLESLGWESRHWSTIGETTASDHLIMDRAKANGYHVVTNDLDFSAILAATRAEGPSVIQIRGQDLSPDTLAPTLVAVIRAHAELLDQGAILTLDLRSARVRSLPLG
jgi:predicted nuclease of predicted toxin-antitoxin system